MIVLNSITIKVFDYIKFGFDHGIKNRASSERSFLPKIMFVAILNEITAQNFNLNFIYFK